ncbi:MAG: PDR/VanB family oxidoreductase [Gammaproteobacteria bacterium]|nr:PDR/VanB family oxidoreductase [Gammaproteobacteria bacterium]
MSAARDIVVFDLRNADGEDLDPFEPGAHVTLVTPSGARRNYSIANDSAERHRYVLAVKLERGGRGGSSGLINGVGEGDLIEISQPQNSFALVEAAEYLLIAGGIGITPIMSMLHHLSRSHANYRLIYCTRDAEVTAFREVLAEAPFSSQVEIHHDAGDADRIFDFWPVLETPSRAHVYCCGPRPMMDDVRDMTGHWPHGSIHFEDFASDVQPIRPDDTAFKVRHADTGQVFEIAADATILDTLRGCGEDLASSCESGTCGTCKTELLGGEPDHRDRVLEDTQRDGYIMVCVSRARSDELVLRW